MDVENNKCSGPLSQVHFRPIPGIFGHSGIQKIIFTA